MIIGPFWCEEENSWLRFISLGDTFTAEIATRKEEQLELATEWRSETNKDFWLINYKPGSNEFVIEGLRLLAGHLYHTDYKVNKYTKAIKLGEYNAKGQFITHNGIRRINPFEGWDMRQFQEFTPYENLPLTQEMQEVHLKNIQRFQAQQEQLQELQKQKWLEWQTKNISAPLDFAEISSFTQEQSAALYQDLSLYLLTLSPENYLSYETYLYALNSAISDPKYPIHGKILEFAARTNVDIDQNLNPDHSETVRAQLFEKKQAFAYDLLKAERERLLRHFEIEITPIETVPLKSLATPAKMDPQEQRDPLPVETQDQQELGLQNPLYQSLIQPRSHSQAQVGQVGQEDINVFQRFVNFLLFNNTQRQPIFTEEPENGLEDEQIQLQKAIELSIALNPSQNANHPVSKINEELNKTNIQLIQDSVDKAVTNYTDWYQHKKDHRGPNGFFSWLRHGTFGQETAKTLKINIHKSTIEEEDAITQINTFLTGKNTRFEKHSLASFLLDELRLLKNLPWNGISPDTVSNRYDASKLPQQLERLNSTIP
jgi:hypothetical protein